MNYSIVNPYTQKVLHTYNLTPQAESMDALALVRAGRETQSKLKPYQRFEILMNFRALIDKNTEELAKLIMQETGKVITEARGEVKRMLVTLEVSAEEAKRINGEAIHAR